MTHSTGVGRGRRPLTLDDFWARVDRSGGPDACWPWVGPHDGKGYGRYGRRGKANRIALESALGRSLTTEEQACHHCDYPPCCNPAHLYAGNATTNAHDMVVRGRHRNWVAPGSLNPNAKLREADIPRIRERMAHGDALPTIARDYGVSHAAVDLDAMVGSIEYGRFGTFSIEPIEQVPA